MLAVEHVGIHDDFFQLGGDSLPATQLISRIREALHVEVSLLSFFDTPTVAGLIENRGDRQPSRARPTGSRHYAYATPGPLPAAVAQEQLWFLNQILPGLPLQHTLCRASDRVRLNVRALELSFNEIIKRHEALRTAFAVMQWATGAGDSSHPERASQDGRPLSIARGRARARSPAPDGRRDPAAFDLAQRPLLRLSLLRLGEREHVLLLTIHHIISDGWSMSVFAHELTVLYERLLR